MNVKNIVLFFSLFLFQTIYVMEQYPESLSFAIEYGPWREAYLHKAHGQPKDQQQAQKKCILCTIHTTDKLDQEYILYKGQHSYLTLNINPYISTGHHFLVIPYEHEKHYNALLNETQNEIDSITHYVCESLAKQSYEIDAFFHIGTYALASIPDHIHQHIISTTKSRHYSLPEAIEQSTQPVNLKTQYDQLLPLFQMTIVPLYQALSEKMYDHNCYYCKILQQNDDKKNLIIYRNEQVTILLSHHPFCAGDTIIIPNDHYTNRTQVPEKTLAIMKSLVIQIYPLLLELLNATDINLGMVSYGDKSTDKKHIKYQITPRQGIPPVSPTTHMSYIQIDIPKLLEKLQEKLFT
jgi:diadenosine tetraphosphate (Ap4A) HIT family hydrolase